MLQTVFLSALASCDQTLANNAVRKKNLVKVGIGLGKPNQCRHTQVADNTDWQQVLVKQLSRVLSVRRRTYLLRECVA